MKKKINEFKRMQLLAGLITESSNPKFDQIALSYSNTAPNTPPGATSGIPTVTKVEKQTLPFMLSYGKDLILTLSNGEKITISSETLNGIYGNDIDHPEEVIGDEWDQPPYVDESQLNEAESIEQAVNEALRKFRKGKLNELSPQLKQRAYNQANNQVNQLSGKDGNVGLTNTRIKQTATFDKHINPTLQPIGDKIAKKINPGYKCIMDKSAGMNGVLIYFTEFKKQDADIIIIVTDKEGYEVDKGKELLKNVGKDFDAFIEKVRQSEVTGLDKKELEENEDNLDFKQTFNSFKQLSEISAELRDKASKKAWNDMGDQTKGSLEYEKKYNQFKKFSSEVTPDTQKEVNMVAKDIEANINNPNIKIKGRINKSTTSKNDKYVYIYFEASGDKQGPVLELIVSNKGTKIVDEGNKLGNIPEAIKRRLLTLGKKVQKNELVDDNALEENEDVNESTITPEQKALTTWKKLKNGNIIDGYVFQEIKPEDMEQGWSKYKSGDVAIYTKQTANDQAKLIGYFKNGEGEMLSPIKENNPINESLIWKRLTKFIND